MNKYSGKEVRPQWQKMHPLKAERVTFLLNGNKFFKGVTLAVSRARYKDFEVLLDAVTAALRPHVTLPSAITHFYRVDGSRVDSIECFADGDIILSSTKHNYYKHLDYQVNNNFMGLISSVNRWNDLRIVPSEKMVPDCKTFSIHTYFCSLEPMKKDDPPLIDPPLIHAPCARVPPTSRSGIGNPFWEADVLRSLNSHTNIVALFCDFDGANYLVAVKEWLDTNAEDVIRKQGPLWEADARTLARGTVAGLSHLHRLQIVHRDVRPASLMLQVLPDGTPLFDTVKIGNFGSSAFYMGSKLTRCCGTPDYAAPEMTSGKGYDLKVDCWSLGLSVFFMLYGKLPFGDQVDTMQVVIPIAKKENVILQWDALGMVVLLLQRDPAERATIDQIAQHAWLQAH